MRQVGVIVMGNNQQNAQTTWLEDRRKECLDRANRRLTEYSQSKRRPLSELATPDRLKDLLRPGDILSRTSNIGIQLTSSGDFNVGGLFKHYAIYVKYLGQDKHQIIEKVRRTGQNEESIIFTQVSSRQLATFYLVVDSRYQDTLETALWVQRARLDGGFISTHSNDEHFVTFCLTRCTLTSRSGEIEIGAVVKDLFALPSCAIGNAAKILTHPFYMIGGDMPLQERMVKTAVPFGMDGEKVATGQTIMIGFGARSMWHYWLEIDKEPSGHTLHQIESRNPEDDNRVIKYHR